MADSSYYHDKPNLVVYLHINQNQATTNQKLKAMKLQKNLTGNCLVKSSIYKIPWIKQ